MNFNDTYLNKTANKDPRDQRPLPSFVIWHETASPNPDNPKGTLDYNLIKDGKRGSYHYLIARDGTVYRYLDPTVWIAYGAGVASSARGYTSYDVNIHSISVELDGRNDGTGVTAAQLSSAAALAVYFQLNYRIPLAREYHLGHVEVAPTHKSDPRGYTVEQVLKLAREATQPAQPKILEVFDLAVRYRVKTAGVWLRSYPDRRADTVQFTRTGAGWAFPVDVVVEGAEVEGSRRWLRIPGPRGEAPLYAHESQLVQEALPPAQQPDADHVLVSKADLADVLTALDAAQNELSIAAAAAALLKKTQRGGSS